MARSTTAPAVQPIPRQSSAGTLDIILKASIGLMLAGLVCVIYDAMLVRLTSVGDSAPQFEIVADNGKTITRDNFGGKLLVLNFWATWCPPCIDELPSLNEFAKVLAPKGVVVVGISVDKDEKVYKEFLSRFNLSFVTARDPTNKINLDYGSTKFPETYIIDSTGTVRRKLINSQDWMAPSMLQDVQSLL